MPIATAPVASAAPSSTSAPPGEELDEIALAMCAATYREEGGGRIVGCRRPPPFRGKGRGPDGKMPRFESDDLTTFCGITLGERGSFSGPNKSEILVTIDNCRDADTDEGWNGSMSGSAAIVARDGDRWLTRAATRNVNTDSCLVLRRRDGHDMLVCRSRYDASFGTDHYFFMLDFAREPPLAKTIAHLFDDVDNWTCGLHDGQTPMAPTGITRLRIAAVSTADVNGDGAADIVIDVERAHAVPSAKLEARLRASCKDGRPVAEALPPPSKHRLEILGDAKAFVATPATRALLDKWRAESAVVAQLEGAAPPELEH